MKTLTNRLLDSFWNDLEIGHKEDLARWGPGSNGLPHKNTRLISAFWEVLFEVSAVLVVLVILSSLFMTASGSGFFTSALAIIGVVEALNFLGNVVFMVVLHSLNNKEQGE